MAIDRQGTGLAVVRICIGVFFIFEGLGKLRWFISSAMLASQLNGWLQTAAAPNHWYLTRIAIPWTSYFARLVPLGELTCGTMLVLGVWTPLFAFIAFFMAFNFNFASGMMFRSAFLTNGYALPVLGSTLGLAIGGVRLPWSTSR